MENLETDFERAQYLQTLLIATATEPSGDNRDYQLLRQYFLEKPDTKPLIPSWVRTNRDLAQFWQFIKYKFRSYAELSFGQSLPHFLNTWRLVEAYQQTILYLKS